MAQPVWTLSVDLQAKTATFTSGLSDAAKAARGSFNEIKDGAGEMGASTSYSMTEARHSVMLLGEEFGVHLPRALTSFIASLGPIGAAMEAAFPFLAIVVGATLLLQHLAKLKAEGAALTESQLQFGTTVANVLNGWNDKLLQAGIRTDELNGNHLAALHKQLLLIDHQNLNELVRSFDTLSKGADATFAHLKAGWEFWKAGSSGAKASLEQFKTAYASLLAQGKDKEANELLDGKIEREQKILALQKEASSTTAGPSGAGEADMIKAYHAKAELQKMSATYGKDEVASQEALVSVLRAQAETVAAANAVKKADQGNATHTEQNQVNAEAGKEYEAQQRGLAEYVRHREEAESRVSALRKKAAQEEEALGEAKLHADDAFLKVMKSEAEEREKLSAEAGKQEAEHAMKMGELRLAAEREAAQALSAQGRMTKQEQLSAELKFEQEDFQIHKQALTSELTALDQHDKEFENKKRQLNNKLEELDRQHANKEKQIQDQSAQQQAAIVAVAENRIGAEYARGFSQVLMGKESFGKAMIQADGQLLSSMLQNSLTNLMQMETVQGRKRFGDARTAASDAFASAGNPILGALAAAGAFATVMAFEDGGIVPGVGRGDIVPARLEPGEAVLPKQMTENLSKATGSDNSGPRMTLHHHANYTVHALDADGVDKVLQKHGDKFTQHAVNVLRKMNK